jgi:glycosyltransferase involved in cell wall biosynthesis
MKVVLATGIYPPEIGGPATYVRHLAEELVARGAAVTVVTYGKGDGTPDDPRWSVIRVGKKGGTFGRWRRYAKALRDHGYDADILYAFSSVSCGIPVRMSGLRHPIRVLRLGGDFFWERYTDMGGRRSLAAFYKAYPGWKRVMRWVLGTFDEIVFSTEFQQRLYERAYRRLPPHQVIENAVPAAAPARHLRHDPFRLLFMGRFVRFKNISSLLHAVAELPYARLALVGDGPLLKQAAALARQLHLTSRVTFQPSSHGEDKARLFAEHDLLVLPSLTEISPHVALEARAAGLPVLLTEDNGLSTALTQGMLVRPLHTSADITRGVIEADQKYEEHADAASAPYARRTWSDVTAEHAVLFEKLLAKAVTHS